jgi:hypothetical protein
MLSTSVLETLIESSQMLGASGYICKPSSYPERKILFKLLIHNWKGAGSAGFIVEEPNHLPLDSHLISQLVVATFAGIMFYINNAALV